MYCLWSVLSLALLLMSLAAECTGQDVRVRQEAETLLEHANSLSTPHEVGSYEQTITFRSFSQDGSQEGRFTRVVQADHGFFCDERASYEPRSARQAWALTLEFLRS